MLREILSPRFQTVSADPERLRRTSLAASRLFGLAITRHILKLAPITALDHDTLVAQVAPTIQHYLTGTAVAALARPGP